MWYRHHEHRKAEISAYQKSLNQKKSFNELLIKKSQEQLRFLEEAKSRNPDKLDSIESQIAEIQNKIQSLSENLFGEDPNGENYYYHSTSASPDDLRDSGFDPEYGAYNDHNTFAGDGYTFFSASPQNGYGEQLYRVPKDKYNFVDDGGEFATKDFIPSADIHHWNGDTWNII